MSAFGMIAPARRKHRYVRRGRSGLLLLFALSVAIFLYCSSDWTAHVALTQPGADKVERRGLKIAGGGVLASTAALLFAGGRSDTAHRSPGNCAAWLHELNHRLESGAGSALLGLAALVSVVLANIELSSGPWLNFWNAHVCPHVGSHSLTVKGWVNEGLMTVFFFNVGLEIKKEMTEGSLSTPSQAALPCIAAVGGMVTPMLVYCAINSMMVGGSLAGITIPMATDIAFAVGVFSLFRKSMPASAESFLLALATADDVGAIVVIAVFFASTITPLYLVLASATLVASAFAGYQGFHGSARFYFVPGVALWYFMLRAGINADIAGVLLALCIPSRCLGGHNIVERLLNRWTPVCAIFILPVFALANCAVPLGGYTQTDESTSWAVPAGVFFGLLVGKPLGIFGFTWMAVQCGVSKMPEGMRISHLLVVGILGGIGFTMCLFLVENSLTGKVALLTKLTILVASLVAAIGGALGLSLLTPATHRTSNKSS
eukprot:TRINITY_DN35009_c0_g1_i1.p1 TRINITY_DN35009_c0_g1~~TRINITY_DN35009_c0_g1_i1.p1  ORF type:complete len:498 (+),score=77.42 TRINITY_DN35009_c0_g1_i1:28-1494(+)